LRSLSFFTALHADVAPPPSLPAPPAVVNIELPDLSGFPTPGEKVRFLLHKAAEIEHALLVQYLYAAYSLKTPADVTDPQQTTALGRWPQVILGIAKEEMGHLLTVQNLLLATRQPVNLERDDFPQAPSLYPFTLQLEPLTQSSLAKYVVTESPVDATGIEDIIKLATQGAGMMPNRVGVLYALLGVVFTREGELEKNAAGGDPWYQLVRDVGYLAFLKEPGPSRWHLTDADYDFASLPRQARDDEWAPADAIRVWPIGSRQAALDALRDIALQGEGPLQPVDPAQVSHFERFRAIFRGDANVPPFPAGDWQPARNVPLNPVLDGPAGATNLIELPKAKDFATLSDIRYALLLGFLEQFFLVAPGSRGFLIGWCFDEMRMLKLLSVTLTGLHRSTQPGAVAALPFGLPNLLHLPPDPTAQWQVHLDRLSDSITLVERMLQTHSPGNAVLTRLRQEDQQKKQRAQQAQQGLPPVPLGRWEQVRRILDAAAGIGRPSHGAAGRFWNQPLADFLQLSILDLPLIAPVGPNRGKNSNLVKALKGEAPFDGTDFPQMPKGRPPVATEYIAFIEKWIDDGCPEI
jgi:hypothetical protein